MLPLAVPAPVPNAVAFRDARHGVLASSDAPRGGSVALTGDGGRTWRVVLRTRRPVVSVAYAGPRVVMAGLEHGGSLRSIDGGRSWRAASARFTGTASFADARHGLAVAGPFGGGAGPIRLARTADGGGTWRIRAGPCPQATGFNAFVSSPTPSLAWLLCTGEGSAGSEMKQLFRSVDGGGTWRAVAETAHAGLSGYGYPIGVSVAPDGFGLVWETRGTLHVTRDGGRSWHAQAALVRPELDFGRSATALPGGVGYTLVGRGDSYRLLATRDAGRSWHVVHRWR